MNEESYQRIEIGWVKKGKDFLLTMDSTMMVVRENASDGS